MLWVLADNSARKLGISCGGVDYQFLSHKMIHSPDLIHYACIAKGAIVLAEFNTKDAALGAIAARCLFHTPPHHATFSHTVRSKTYAFLIDAPFVYFAISDDRLENFEILSFLRSVRDTFRRATCFDGARRTLEKMTSHCFQGEFNPVFRQLLGPALYHTDGIGSPSSGRDPIGRGIKANKERVVHKMKNMLLRKIKLGGEKENDDNGGHGIGLSREFSLFVNKNGELYPAEVITGQHHKAMKIWKRHLWIVLSLDLFICFILLGVWLWVCSGLQCMES